MATLYEKIGRRYRPVADTDWRGEISNGSWLVRVDRGLTQVRRAVSTEAGMQAMAASLELAEWIAEELVEWSRVRPTRALTPTERKAWAAYCAIAGEDATLTLQRDSAMGIAERVARRVAERAAGVIREPAEDSF